MFEQLINILNYLIETNKLVCKFEKKWNKVLYKDQQFEVNYYDCRTDKKIYDDLYYNSSLNTFKIDFFKNELIETNIIQDTKNYILFDLGKKKFVLLNGKELKSGIFIRKDIDILSNLVRDTATKIIILDDTFIDDKFQYILNFKNFNIQYSDIKSLFVDYYTNFINSITDKFILIKNIIKTNNKDLNSADIKANRYIPLLSHYITFNIYDDFCEHLPDQIFNDLSELKANIVKLLLKYEIINKHNFLNIYIHKEFNDKNNCYITIEINFDYKNILDIILMIDALKIVQKL